MHPTTTHRRRLDQRLIVVASFALFALALGARPCDAARVVIKVGPARPHAVVVRTAVVKPVPRRVWKAGHWEYRPALHARVWIPGHWVTMP